MSDNAYANEQERETAFMRFMSRHLVALVGEYESYMENGDLLHHGMFVFSGFVIELNGRWFWTTAGHCLEDFLETPIRKDQMKVLQSGFADYFGTDSKSETIVRYDYHLGDGFFVQKPDLGLDFAIVPLPDLLRKNLEHNGVVPITRPNWSSQDHLRFDHYMMLGFPAHLIPEPERDNQGAILSGAVRPVMLSVERVDTESAENAPLSPWFVGQLNKNADVPNIEGMSGGPIYGFRRLADGRWVYHVVALQSRWNRQTRTIYGCSVPAFAEAVLQGFRDTYISAIRDVASSFRKALLLCAPELVSPTLSHFPQGSCGDASLLLGKCLEDKGLGTFSYVTGIAGDQTHAWLEEDGIIVDVTADQFGGELPGVIVTEDGSWHQKFEQNGHRPCYEWNCDPDLERVLLADFGRIIRCMEKVSKSSPE